MKKLFFFQPLIVSEKTDKEFKLKWFLLIFAVFISSIVITNIIGTKIISVFGFNVTAGIITYAVVFLCTDVVSEVWGKRLAYYLVAMGFVASVFMYIFVVISIHWQPASFWETQEAYKTTLGPVGRILFASMIAYLVSQLHDVMAYDFWYRVTKGNIKLMFIRNNLSTFVSQFLDTILFISIAFWNVLTIQRLINMVIAQILIKWILALLDTPFIYAVVLFLKGSIKGRHEGLQDQKKST